MDAKKIAGMINSAAPGRLTVALGSGVAIRRVGVMSSLHCGSLFHDSWSFSLHSASEARHARLSTFAGYKLPHLLLRATE